MANTTNYNWETPDDTDLVKDGALAIRTLGSSIDTTTKALNPSTTLGDIEYRSSTANTNTRLGIGSSGQVLTVSGGVPAWASPAGGGGFTLLSTTSLSGNSVTVSSIDQTYKHLYIEITGITYSNPSHTLYLAPNSVDNTALVRTYLSSGTITNNGDNASSNIAGADLKNTDANNAFSFWYYNYASTTEYKPASATGSWINPSNGIAAIDWTGTVRDNAAITSIRTMIGNSFSNPFNSGTMRIYGVK